MLAKKVCIGILVTCLTSHWSDAVLAQSYELRIEAPANVPPGTEFEARLVGRSLVRLIGYSASIRYDSALTLRSISVADTAWESADLKFFDEQPATGTVSIGVILDDDGQGVTNVLALGATTFARLTFAATVPAVATIGFTDNPDFNLLIDVDLNGYDGIRSRKTLRPVCRHSDKQIDRNGHATAEKDEGLKGVRPDDGLYAAERRIGDGDSG